jgi:hypothetical protein
MKMLGTKGGFLVVPRVCPGYGGPLFGSGKHKFYAAVCQVAGTG